MTPPWRAHYYLVPVNGLFCRSKLKPKPNSTLFLLHMVRLPLPPPPPLALAAAAAAANRKSPALFSFLPRFMGKNFYLYSSLDEIVTVL